MNQSEFEKTLKLEYENPNFNLPYLYPSNSTEARTAVGGLLNFWKCSNLSTPSSCSPVTDLVADLKVEVEVQVNALLLKTMFV